MTLDDDKHQAESLLHELATELRRVPLCAQTRGLHLRALALKREVSGWDDQGRDVSERGAVLQELGELQRHAQSYRELPTGRRLAYAIVPSNFGIAFRGLGSKS
jgi:hypothetical protein